MAPDTPDDGDPTRRRVVRGGAAAAVALLGAGFLRPSGGPDESNPPALADPTPPAPRRSLGVSLARTVDGPAPEEPTGGRRPTLVFGSRNDGPRTESSDDSPPDAPSPEPAPDDESPGADGGGAPVEEPGPSASGDTALVVDAPPVAFADLAPGSRGRVTATATLAGDPADLWLAARGVDGGENGLVEPERSAGDDGAAGELLAALRVRLAVDGTTLYEGPLAGLDVTGVRVAGCVTGDRSLALDWTLPETAGNAVQTDAAGVVLRLGATDCGGPTPFAARGAEDFSPGPRSPPYGEADV
jgi:hypothetical protein